MENKTWQFGTILDSATRFTSCRRFSEFVFVAENRQPSSQGNYCSSTITYCKENIYPQQKWILKYRRQEMDYVAESEIFPDRRVFVPIVSREIEEKVEKYSQSIY